MMGKKAETCKEDCKYVTVTLEGDNIVDFKEKLQFL
jgi:hypothetical protein